MKVVITGKSGQLGWELLNNQPDGVEIYAFNSRELNIADSIAVTEKINTINPDFVFNAAAYTAVDKAENDVENCYQVNKVGAANLAKACYAVNAKLIHVSTDFVFDGCQNTPYMPEQKTNPIGVYGESKLAGENEIRSILPHSSIIIRTAWVYSVHGNNFVKTMLKLMADKSQLGVVYDQVGTPTWAHDLAATIWKVALGTENGIIEEQCFGKTYHWTDAGVASWYDFAVAIQKQGFELGLLDQRIPINAIPASAYPTPAARPSYSVLDKTALEAIAKVDTTHWQENLGKMLEELSSIK